MGIVEEILIKQTNQLQIRTNELSEITISTHHELITPFRNVLLFSQKLKVEYGHPGTLMDTKGEGYISFITDGANKAIEIVKALQRYIEIETNPQVEQVQMDGLFDETVKKISKNYHIAFEVKKNSPLPVLAANKAHLTDILAILLDNSFKYSKPNHSLEITVTWEKVQQKYLFSLMDNGIGFEQSEAEKIFVLFSRLHTEKTYSGLGLGLALVKKIINIMGGELWAKSQPNQGATFYFTLPG